MYRKFDSFNVGTVHMTELPIQLKTKELRTLEN